MRLRTLIKYTVVLIAVGALEMGSLWQIEISILNENHGWEFAYLFTWIQGVNNWAARDFFFTVNFLIFCAMAIACLCVGYSLGKEEGEKNKK